MDDELLFIEPHHDAKPAATVLKMGALTSSATGTSKTMGTWYFDKRQRKRKYIALTGKVYEGPDAVRVARQDQKSESNPHKAIRFELKYLMSTAPSSDHDVFPLTKLSSWGFPPVLATRYAKMKVETLFQWQVECLTSHNGAVLYANHHLIYSAPTSGGKTLVSEILMLRQLARHIGAHTDLSDSVREKDASSVPKNRHTIFFVVPFVALAEEKAAYFQDVWQDMNIGVKAFHGDGGDSTGNILSEDVEVAVCTIERANILLTQLLDEGREDQLKMVVIDEIHMLADAQRGFLLEVMLSKIKYLLNDSVQVVGMSATLPNIADLAGWLGAALYTTQYRPVDLEVKVCLDRKLYRVSKENTLSPAVAADGSESTTPTNANASAAVPSVEATQCSVAATAHSAVWTAHTDTQATMQTLTAETQRAFQDDPVLHLMTPGVSVAVTNGAVEPPAAVSAIYELESAVEAVADDPDGMKRLCLETVQHGKSVMLFCNSKRRCEVCASAVAESLTKHTPNHNTTSAYTNFTAAASTAALASMRAGRLAMIESLSQTQVGLCPVLRATLPYGVAYHHAGLTLDERKVVEDGFRQGFVQVLCTTSTLSAGVNLPAHRVIIRSPRMGDKFLNVAGFRQMCGRAGRMGLDAKGEAILMIMTGNKIEKSVADHLLTADVDPLRSHLHIAVGGGLEKLLLEMISCGRLCNESSVMKFVDCTLMRVQQPYAEVLNYTKEALIFLKKEQFVQSLHEGELSPSPLGIATTVSGITPKDAVQILKPLLDARTKLILKGGLHPVYLVTPPSAPIEPDWKNYEKILHTLYQEHPDAQAVAVYLGIEEGQLVTFAFNPPARTNTSPKVQLYRRFFCAILLFTLVQEWPITSVARLISSVTRGQLQQLQKDAAVFCGMTVVFCRKLNWPLLAACLEDFSSRLNYGVHKDILPLVRLGQEITAARARAFLKNGIESAQDILYAGLPLLTELLVESLPYDGKDPLQVSASNHGSGKNELSRSKEASREMCERLARKIVLRAKDYLKEEATRLTIFEEGR